MDWHSLGKTIAGTAPVLGTVLGGPFGGAIGTLIASVFGVKGEPEEVARAIAAAPQALVRLREIEQDHIRELRRMILEAETQRIESVNATMRTESLSEHWPQYSWRPFWGFVSALAFLAVCILVSILAYQAVLGGRPEAVAMIPQFISAMATLFLVPGGILGVAAWHRGIEKRMRAGAAPPPGLLERAAAALGAKREAP